MFRTILLLTVFSCLCCTSATAQEFPLHDNGLIYSKETINRVKAMVDSVNNMLLKAPEKDYYSIEQGVFHMARLLEENWPKQKKDIAANISFADFVKKYPATEKQENIHISRQGHRADTLNCYFFYTQQLDPVDRVKIDAIDSNFNYSVADMTFFDNGSGAKTNDYYFTVQHFRKYKLPRKYAHMIQYSDAFFDMKAPAYAHKGFACMMHGTKYNNNNGTAVKDFLEYALKHSTVDKEYLKKLDDAIYEAMAVMEPVPKLEEYVLRLKPRIVYLQLLLKTKSSFVAIGEHDPNSAPRKLALEIATMAAAEGNLDLFLRMHLDLETDNFPRRQFNYDFAKQGHYLKELAATGINLPHFLMGLVLKAGNAPGHYYMDEWNISDAIAKYENPQPILDEIYAAITDKDLDIVNRIALYDLYKSTIGYMKGDANTKGLQALKQAKLTLPSYYHNQREIEE